MAVLDWNGEVHDETDGIGVASVRRRLVLALAVIFASQVLLWTLLGDLESGEGDVQPVIAFLRVVIIGVALPLLMVILARAILAPAERLEAARDHFRQEYDRARLTALLDPLTGLGNHRAFQEELARTVSDAQGADAPLALLLLDLDDLKRINDERGHAGGDDALAAMGRLLVTSTRHADRAFRIGGDEFAVLMPNTDAIAAFAIARRLLAAAVETTDERTDPRALVLRRHRRPGPGDRRQRPALPPGRRGALLVQATRSDRHPDLRPAATWQRR